MKQQLNAGDVITIRATADTVISGDFEQVLPGDGLPVEPGYPGDPAEVTEYLEWKARHDAWQNSLAARNSSDEWKTEKEIAIAFENEVGPPPGKDEIWVPVDLSTGASPFTARGIVAVSGITPAHVMYMMRSDGSVRRHGSEFVVPVQGY